VHCMGERPAGVGVEGRKLGWAERREVERHGPVLAVVGETTR